jgi:hypothetical protein
VHQRGLLSPQRALQGITGKTFKLTNTFLIQSSSIFIQQPVKQQFDQGPRKQIRQPENKVISKEKNKTQIVVVRQGGGGRSSDKPHSALFSTSEKKCIKFDETFDI